VGGDNGCAASHQMLAQQILQERAALRIECSTGFIHEPQRSVRTEASQGESGQLQALFLSL